jgi:hypothetical protein
MGPIVNLEEPIGKTVGGRRVGDPFSAGMSKEASERWRAALGGVGIPKGVYRFASFAEADEWTMKMLTRPRKS